MTATATVTAPTTPEVQLWTLEASQYTEVAEALEKLAAKARKLGMTGADLPGTHVVRKVPAVVWAYSARPDYGQGSRPVAATTVLPEDAKPPVSYQWNGFGAVATESLYRTHLVTFTLTGTAPRMDGWSFAATLEVVTVFLADGVTTGTEVQVRRFPGSPVLPETWDVGNGTSCDHCGKARKRSTTLVVTHEDGRIMRVGKTCLKDFLGHASPEQVLNQLVAITALMEAAEAEDGMPRSGHDTFDPATYVRVACSVARVDGFVSRKASQEDWTRTATAVTVEQVLGKMVRPQASDRAILEKYAATDADKALAVASLTWARGLKATTEFESNLSLAARMTEATRPNQGILAYLPVAYKRVLEQRAEALVTATSTVQGAVGDKLTRAVSVTFSQGFESSFGTSTLHLLIDADGNRYKWWASSQAVAIGSTATVTMTVKAHDTKKEDCTVVTRVKPVKGTEWVTCE